MNAKILTVGVALSVIGAWAAENHTIDSGDALVLSANAVYGELTVNGSLTIGENVTVTASCVKCSVDASQPQSEIHLLPGSRLVTTKPWEIDGSGVCHTYFKGGTLTFPQMKRFGTGTNIFEAVGHDIKLDIVDSYMPVFYYTSNDPRILLTGNGGLVKTGSNAKLLNDYHYSQVIVMSYTGETWINEGGIELQACNLPSTTRLHIGQNGYLGLNGNIIEYASVDGDGYIRDADNNRAYFKITGDGDSEILGLDTIGTRLEKKGNGTLTVAPRNSLDFLNLVQGKVVLKSRAEAGFRSYAFKVDEGRGPGSKWDCTQMGELYFFNDAGEDVTPFRSNHTSPTFNDGSVPCLFDRKAGTKWFSNVNYKSTPEQKDQSASVEVRFPRQMPVSSYLWGTAWDMAPRDPSAWRIVARAGFSDKTWMTLATVTNFAATTTRNADASPTNFVLTVPSRVTVPQVTLLNRTELEVSGKTELYTTNLVSATFCRVDLKSGGTLTLDPQVDQEKTYLRIAGDGTLRKEGSRTLTLLGATDVRGGVHVAGGTLKIKAGHEVAPKAFRFTFTKGRWLAQNPTGDWRQHIDYHTIQFGEIALYDDKFNRINLKENLSYYSVADLFDDDTATSCYNEQVPPQSYDVTFAFNDSVTANATCYRFHPETRWGGVWDKTPGEWTVSVSDSTNGPWTVIEQRLSTATSLSGWNSWNNGTPFFFTNRIDKTEAAFASSCNVQVDPGATLDLSDSATVISNLTVDCSCGTSVGTLVGGALAEAGVLNLVNVSGSLRDVDLPLAVSGTALPGDFGAWRVCVDGVPQAKVRLAVSDGRFHVYKDGFLILVR